MARFIAFDLLTALLVVFTQLEGSNASSQCCNDCYPKDNQRDLYHVYIDSIVPKTVTFQ